MDDEDAGGQPSGLLSPRRIEAIHIAFTKVFDTACKQGIIRDPSTYKSFDHVFDKAMKRQRGEDVESESGDLRPVEPLGGDVEGEAMDIVEETTTTTATVVEKSTVEKSDGGGGRSVQVVVNKEEVVKDEEMYFSDDEDVSKQSLQDAKRKRQKPNYSTDRIDGTSTKSSFLITDFEDDIGFKKPKRMRHSEPPIANHSRNHPQSLPNSLLLGNESPPRKTFTPQRIQ